MQGNVKFNKVAWGWADTRRDIVFWVVDNATYNIRKQSIADTQRTRRGQDWLAMRILSIDNYVYDGLAVPSRTPIYKIEYATEYVNGTPPASKRLRWYPWAIGVYGHPRFQKSRRILQLSSIFISFQKLYRNISVGQYDVGDEAEGGYQCLPIRSLRIRNANIRDPNNLYSYYACYQKVGELLEAD